MKIIKEKIDWKQGSKFKKNNPEVAIIHHALSKKCSIHDVNRWHLNNNWNGFGYHFFIDKKGNVYEGRKIEWNGCHTKGMNQKSIGICLEGCYTHYNINKKTDLVEKVAPKEQINSLVDLLIYLDLPFKYHRNFTNTKDCPGIYFVSEDVLRKLINNKTKVDNFKVDEVSKAVKFGYIDNDKWKDRINDNIQVWAVLEMLNDIHDKFDKETKELRKIIESFTK